jgi:hypothetical protein
MGSSGCRVDLCDHSEQITPSVSSLVPDGPISFGSGSSVASSGTSAAMRTSPEKTG